MIQQQQNLGQRFGTSKMYLSPPILRRWFCCCWFVVDCYSHCGILWLFYVLLCVNFVSILVLLSSRLGRGSWLFCLVCPPGVSCLLWGSSSRCHEFVRSLWLWYFLYCKWYEPNIPNWSEAENINTLLKYWEKFYIMEPSTTAAIARSNDHSSKILYNSGLSAYVSL